MCATYWHLHKPTCILTSLFPDTSQFACTVAQYSDDDDKMSFNFN